VRGGAEWRDRTLVVTSGGQERLLRTLQPQDAERFATFLEGLSDNTRARYSPHPLTAAEAHNICCNLKGEVSARAIATVPPTEAIVGYVLAEIPVPPEEVLRYQEYAIDLPPGTHRIAPVVADSEQGRGLGSALMGWVLEKLRRSGAPMVVLFGGVQADNSVALRLYNRFGFVRGGSFFNHGVESYDMYVSHREDDVRTDR
jgi:ribosomal protein S18 acetylase RimI-like enzyme